MINISSVRSYRERLVRSLEESAQWRELLSALVSAADNAVLSSLDDSSRCTANSTAYAGSGQ
jgi:hypothetical protein